MGPYPADISGYKAAALLSRRYPNLSLDLRVVDWPRAKESVLRGTADLAFADIREAAENSDFVCQPVRSGAVTFFCRAQHPLAAQRSVEMDGPSFPASVSGAMEDAAIWIAAAPVPAREPGRGRGSRRRSAAAVSWPRSPALPLAPLADRLIGTAPRRDSHSRPD